ncbi:LamG domain-containing protein [Chloroflexota bacterium]
MDFIIDPSLVIYLPLYESDGASFISKDTYGHLCTATGAFWKPDGRFLDGEDDVIYVPDHPALRPTEAISIELFMKPLTINVTGEGVISKSPLGAALGDWEIWLDTTACKFSVDKAVTLVVTSTPLIVDYWVHLMFTYDRNKLRVYRDGVPDAEIDSTAAIPTSIDPIRIGVWYQDVAIRHLNFQLGILRIYNRALSSLEVNRNYLVTKWRHQ